MIPIAKPIIGPEEQASVMQVLESGQLAQGKKVREFEEAFASYCDAPYAVAVSSGTTALHLALLAHDIGPGDEVITSPFSFIASANAILYVGATPRFVDIEPDYYTLDVGQLEQAITARTRAIIPVHLFGQPCDMPAILALAEKYNLAVIEDSCQAHGARINGRSVGHGTTACYSFYPTKNMTTGEGGMVTTFSAQVADKIRLLREHGMPQRYRHEILGYNFRMTDIQAAIGLAQLAKLPAWNRKRVANAEYLSWRLAERFAEEGDGFEPMVLPKVRADATHVFHQYTVRVEDRTALLQHLDAHGIGYGIYYPTPIHRQPLYLDLGYDESLPVAEAMSEKVVSLPVHPSLSEAELDKVLAALGRHYQHDEYRLPVDVQELI